MSNNLTKDQIISGFIWKWLERSGAQIVQFAIQIVLARLLLPEEYGLIALISIFITLAEVFVQGGLNTALIQKKDADNKDFSTVFFTSLVLSVVLYLLLYIFAPSISDFYKNVELAPIMRILGLNLIIGSVNSIQNAYISRNMKFKLNFTSSVISAIVSGIIGIVLAYKGYGVWALVSQQLSNQLVIAFVLWMTLGWRPELVFDKKILNSLFSFGSKVLASSLIARLTEQAYGLIIGRIYSSRIIGYYNRGHQFPHLIVNNINGTINSVLLPALSSEQGNLNSLKKITRRSISTSTFLVFPAMAGLAAMAEPLVILLLTDKWLLSIPFIRYECLYYATMPILTSNLQVNKAIGRSEIGFKIEIFKTVITFIVLFISIPYGIHVMMYGRIFVALLMVAISSKVNDNLIGYKFEERFADIIPQLCLSVLMGVIVISIGYLKLSPILTLIIQLVLGSTVYFSASYVFKVKSMRYIANIMKSYYFKTRLR